jgi:hypothetical protein
MISLLLMILALTLWILYGYEKIKIIYPILANILQVLWIIYLLIS